MAFGNRYFTDFEDTYYDLFNDMYGSFPSAPAPAEIDYFANQFADDFKQTPVSPLASIPQSFIDAEQRAYEDQQMVFRDSQARAQALAEQQAEAQRQAEIAAEAARRQAIEDAFYEQQARAQAQQQAEAQRQAKQQAEAQRQAQLAQQAEAQRQALLAQQQAEAQRQAQLAQQAEAQRQAEQQAEAQRQAEQQAEAQRQAQLAQQQAEAARQAELAEQARQAQLAEQRAYEDQQRTYLENQARQEAARVAAEQEAARQGALRQAEAQRLAAEQEAARLAAEQEAARVAAEQEVARQGALQQAEAARQAELAQQAEAARLAAVADTPASRSLSASAGALERATSELGDSRDDPVSRIDSIDRRNAESEARIEANLTPEDRKNIEIANKLATQILDQKLTDKWTGQGYGNAEANARDMGKILASIGITDIKDFGKITKTVDAEVTPQYERTISGYDNEGNPIVDSKIIGYTDQSGNTVDASLVKTEFVSDGETGRTAYMAPVGKQEVFGNKLTGQEVPNTYSERQTGNFFGGTFAGKGNTGYGVQFDAKGNPYFYTVGASSNDLANLMQDLGPLGQIAIAVATGGLSIPQQIAANLAINVLSGKDIGDAIKGAAISYAGAQIPGLEAIKEGTSFLNGIDSTGVLANAFQNAAVSGGTALLSGRDIGDAMMKGAISGGTSGAVNALMGNIDGFKDLTPAQKNMAINAVTGVISGQPLDQIVINTAIAAANNAIAQAKNENTVIDPYFTPSTDTTSTGAGVFVQAKQAGATDAEALSAANAVTGASTNVSAPATTPDVDTTATNPQVTNNTVTGGTGSDNATTSTIGGFDQGEFEGVDRAIEQQSRNTEVERLVTAYEKTTGKSFAKLTDKEVAALAYTANSMTVDELKNASIQDILNKAPAIVGKDDQGRWVDDKGYAYDERGFRYAPGSTAPIVDVVGVGNTGTPTAAQNLDTAGNNLVNWANTLEGTSGDVVRQTLSTLIGAGGEQIADLGTALANMGVAERYNLLVQLGQALEGTGQKLEIPGVTQATENFWNDIQGADTYAGKAAAAIRSVLNNPLVLTQVAKEGLQEVLPIVTGGAVFKILGKGAGIATDVLMNASESMGSQSRQKFNEEIAKGTPVDEAERLANADGWKAFAITTVTAGLADASLVKGYEKAMEKLFGKTTTSVGKEWAEEGFEELAVALATGDDLATAMSKSIAGSTIGSKTSGTFTAGSSVSADIQQAFASEGLTSSDGSFRPETITKITDAGTAGATNTTPDVVTGGADTVAGTDFSTIFLNTGDLTQAIDTSIGSAINSGVDPSVAITSVINAANSVGADPNTVAVAAVNAATTATTAPSTITTAPATVTTAPSTVTTAPATVTTAPATATTAPATATTAPATVTTAPSTATTAPATATPTTAGIDTTVSNTVATAISSGTNPATAVNSAVTTAVSAGTNPVVAIGSAVTAAINAGTDPTTAVTAAVTAATNSGVDTTVATNAANSAATNAATAAAGITTNTTVDTGANTTTTTTTNANNNTTTIVSTNTTTGATTTTNTNNNTGIDTNITQNPDTNTTNKTVTDTNTDLTVSVNIDDSTGEVVSINGPGTVIDKDTVVVDGTPIDVNTGEILSPEEVEKRKKAAVKKTPVSPSRPPSGSGNLAITEPTYAAKKSDIAETWLGGRFRNIAPLAGLGALLPQDSPMFQEAQAISALRRAAGLDEEAEKPEADYYAYGTEPSYAKVLEPFMNGGTVQKYAEGGKIMASPLMAASGGDVPHKGSHYVQGAGGGQDDLIPAQLADGEYVFDADIVAALGDGSNKEGAKKLDAMREAIRKHKRGGSIKSIPPAAKSPLAYLKGVL